ncbi:zinc finger protein 37 homolog [Gigantopelta aegis]|uniref:zinc finger protein 37 homolog n=1 Tax=Gigantopelta aegis TaxID=1735272 RepID=UPI001B88DB52|nr:zinc finger protein 37 homolog [Gigantopelta aegis]
MPEDSTLYATAGFHEHILNTLYSLQQSQDCCDLTLKAKDGQVKVHSLILVASSSFFQQWYNNQKDKSALSFWIPELSLSELKLIIAYFYTGKLVISQESVYLYTTLFERLWVEEAVSLCHQFVVSQQEDSSGREVKHSVTMKLVSVKSDRKDSASSSFADGDDACSSTSFKDDSERAAFGDDKSNKITLDNDHTLLKSSPSSGVSEGLHVALLHSKDLVKKEEVEDAETASEEVAAGSKRTKRRKDNPVRAAVPKTKRRRKARKSEPVSTSERKSKCKLLVRGQTQTRGRKHKMQPVDDVKLEDDDDDKADTEITVTEKREQSDNELGSDSLEESVHTVIKKKTSKRVFTKMTAPKKKPYRYRSKKRLYPCDYCGYVAREKIGLAGHQKSKHQVPFDTSRFTVLTCKDCSFETLVMKRLEKHMAKHTEERPNICEHCGKTFKLQGELNAHVKIHLDPTKFQCSHCNRTFSSPYTLKDHVDNIHLGLKNKQYLCHLCSHTTCDTVKLNQHLYNVHKIVPPPNIKTFKCEDCDFIAFRRFAFINHRKLHEGQRDFQCGVCGKGYITARALRHHMIWHSEKKFACEFEACHYASPSKRQLEQHVRLMHTQRDVKPFACHLCPHRTGVRGNLDKHLRTVHRLDIPDKRKYSHLYMLGRSPKNKSDLPGQPSAESDNNTSYEMSSNTGVVGESQVVEIDSAVPNSDIVKPALPIPGAPSVQEMAYDQAALAHYMTYFHNME